MFYSFVRENLWNFLSGVSTQLKDFEWSVHPHEWTFEWVSGESTHTKVEEVGAAMGWAPSPLYIEGLGLPSSIHSHSHLLVSPPAAPPSRAMAYAKPYSIVSSSPTPRRRVVGVLGGSTTSAAQLERGNGGLRQAVRVTEYGCATSLRRSSSRS